MKNKLGEGLLPGSSHYRAYVGPPEDYDFVSAMCFNLLTTLGLRGNHALLDVGCGSCRVARLLIPYLNESKYYGMEPNKWLVEEGIENEIGNDLLQIKQPSFVYTDNVSNVEKTEYFDFAMAQSIFSHCGYDLLDKHLFDISASLKLSGALVATFIVGDEDTDESGWIYPGCVSFTEKTVTQLAQKNGFKLYMLDWEHPRQRWALFAKPEFDMSWLVGRPLTWNTWVKHSLK